MQWYLHSHTPPLANSAAHRDLLQESIQEVKEAPEKHVTELLQKLTRSISQQTY